MEPEIVQLLVDALAAEEGDRNDLRRIVLSACDFDHAVAGARMVFPQWRIGQAHCNVLRVWRPDLYLEVTSTEVDPFSRDDRLPEFRRWLAERTGGECGGGGLLQCNRCAPGPRSPKAVRRRGVLTPL